MKWRLSALNVALAVLTAACAVGLVAFMPGTPLGVRLLAVVGAAAIAVIVAVLAREAMVRDDRRVALFAALRGWSFSHRDYDLADRFSVYPMNVGVGGRVVNVLRGTHRFYEAATFTYVTARPAPQFYQVTMIELGANPPTVEFLPEDAVAAAAKLRGGQDVRVGDADFDSRWRIVTTDPDWARRVATPELRKELDHDDVHGMPLAIDGGAVLTWQAGAAGVRRLSHRLNVLVALARAIPEDAWKAREA